MCLALPDPISLIADIVTLVGVPTLAVSTWKLYQAKKEERKPKGVSQGCVSFYDVDQKMNINLIPFEHLIALPRIGDQITLPGETDNGKSYGDGVYKVQGIEIHYIERPDLPRPASAATSVITVNVRLVSRLS
jgi:hypothetical protein